MPLTFAQTLASSTPVTKGAVTLTETVNEDTTATMVVTVTDSAGGAIANTDYTAITLTLLDEETHAIINSRQDQDVLGAPANIGANNVVIDAAGELTWSMQIADNDYVDPTRTKQIEFHRAIFTIDGDFGSGAERIIHEIRFPLKRKFQPVTTLT